MKNHFLPVQEGTGDPSPDNVRHIACWDGVTVTSQTHRHETKTSEETSKPEPSESEIE